MLVFFIHGVSTRNTTYAEGLQKQISEGLRQRQCAPAYFHAGFWGDVANPLDDGTLWNHINHDLALQQQKRPSDSPDDLFRYQEIREKYISPFVIDLLSYLAPDRGRAIRAKLADQLMHFVAGHPNERDLHIICHSMGTVILWDTLFSERFDNNDPAFQIRQVLSANEKTSTSQKTITLKSITTMGAPILYVNTMLGVKPNAIRQFAAKNSETKLKWRNILHASDIIAYPLKASLMMDDSWNLSFEDVYLKSGDTAPIADWADKALQKVNNIAADVAAIAVSNHAAHQCYWTSKQAFSAIIKQLTPTDEVQPSTSSTSYLKQVMDSFKELEDWQTGDNNKNFHTVLDVLYFSDRSGHLEYTTAPLGFHHIHLFDADQEWRLSGYVWPQHTEKLKKIYEKVRVQFC